MNLMTKRRGKNFAADMEKNQVLDGTPGGEMTGMRLSDVNSRKAVGLVLNPGRISPDQRGGLASSC